MNNKRTLNGKTAVITGSAQKLGAEIAIRMADEGANIVINYRNSESKAKILEKQVRKRNVQCLTIRADMMDSRQIEDLLSKAKEKFGSVDILINNAGPWTNEGFSTLKIEDWNEIIDVNLKATFLASQKAFCFMRKKKWGKIINISSTSSIVRNHAVYGLAKSGVNVLTQSLALEFAPYVTVNAIAPGLIDFEGIPSEIAFPVIETTPIKRLVTMSEVANCVSLLCSPVFDCMTGQLIVLDGGQSIPVVKGV